MVFINQLVTGGSHIVTESLINRNKFGDRSAGLLKYLPVSQPSSIMSNKKKCKHRVERCLLREKEYLLNLNPAQIPVTDGFPRKIILD